MSIPDPSISSLDTKPAYTIGRRTFLLQNLERQFEVYDALYAWCRLEAAKEKFLN